MSGERLAEKLRPWLRETHAPAFEAALEWLLPRCRTEEERSLAPALLFLLSPLNALVVPCRPAAGSCVNFQVTLSRPGATGPERRRVTVRAGAGVQAFRRSGVQEADPARLNARPGEPERLELWLDATTIPNHPLAGAARVLATLLEKSGD